MNCMSTESCPFIHWYIPSNYKSTWPIIHNQKIFVKLIVLPHLPSLKNVHLPLLHLENIFTHSQTEIKYYLLSAASPTLPISIPCQSWLLPPLWSKSILYLTSAIALKILLCDFLRPNFSLRKWVSAIRNRHFFFFFYQPWCLDHSKIQ